MTTKTLNQPIELALIVCLAIFSFSANSNACGAHKSGLGAVMATSVQMISRKDLIDYFNYFEIDNNNLAGTDLQQSSLRGEYTAPNGRKSYFTGNRYINAHFALINLHSLCGIQWDTKLTNGGVKAYDPGCNLNTLNGKLKLFDADGTEHTAIVRKKATDGPVVNAEDDFVLVEILYSKGTILSKYKSLALSSGAERIADLKKSDVLYSVSYPEGFKVPLGSGFRYIDKVDCNNGLIIDGDLPYAGSSGAVAAKLNQDRSVNRPVGILVAAGEYGTLFARTEIVNQHFEGYVRDYPNGQAKL